MTLRTTEEGIEAGGDRVAHFSEHQGDLAGAAGPYLAQVCPRHSSVVHSWGGHWQRAVEGPPGLQLAAEFGAGREAPGQARRLVLAALRRKNYSDTVIADAALVVSELAANAVLHAGSPFSVSVRWRDPMLRIAVSDASPLLGGAPASRGLLPFPEHGLGLVEAVCARWGTEVHSGGKVVWAELRA
jgi:hypothetical protein